MSLNLFVNSGILASSGFSPEQLSSLILWLDASDQTTITQSANAVSQWSDKSGNNNNATQATSAKQPTTNTSTINGNNVISFDGTDDELYLSDFGLQGPCTFLLSFLPTNTSSDIRLISHFDGPNDLTAKGTIGIKANYGDDTLHVFDPNQPTGWVEIKDTTPVILNTSTVLTCTENGSSVYNSYINGVLEKTVTSGVNFNGRTIGIGSKYLDAYGLNYQGFFSEIIIYNRVLSNAERQSVETYLSNKWGV